SQLADNDLPAIEPAPFALVAPNPEEAETAMVDEAAPPLLTEVFSPEEETPPEEIAVHSNESNTLATEQSAHEKTLFAGALLIAAREAAGFSVDDVARLLKLAPRQIQALEQENFTALPQRTFVRGFIRNYARLLKIDAGVVLAALPPEGPQTTSPAAFSVKNPMRTTTVLSSYDKPRFWRGALIVVALAAIAAAFYFWPRLSVLLPKLNHTQTTIIVKPAAAEEAEPPSHSSGNGNSNSGNGHILTPVISPLPETSVDADASKETAPTDSSNDPSPSSASSVSAPAASSTSKPTTSAVGADSKDAELVLRFTGDSWVEVRDKNGKTLYSALAKNGIEKTLTGEPPFSLVLGNNRVATVTLRGEPVGLGSKQGVARLTLE
ncbi:MAG: DUF4115 domain-containing protein, partial [Burkholderiales bacterium]|nr:DUF4115 domain-containing protein [Burkholderiales bacterium]